MKLYVIKDYKAKHPDVKGKALTDHLILKLLDKEAEIIRTESGKPYIKWEQDEKPPFLSVSHCGDVFACVFDDREIGIDVQNERPLDAAKISRRYYSKREQDYTEEAGTTGFFRIWTRKEAFAKYTGRGLAQVMSGEDVLGRSDVCFQDFMILENCYVSLCRPPEKEKDTDYEIQFFD